MQCVLFTIMAPFIITGVPEVPEECVKMIMRKMSPRDVLVFSATCKRFRNLLGKISVSTAVNVRTPVDALALASLFKRVHGYVITTPVDACTGNLKKLDGLRGVQHLSLRDTFVRSVAPLSRHVALQHLGSIWLLGNHRRGAAQRTRGTLIFVNARKSLTDVTGAAKRTPSRAGTT